MLAALVRGGLHVFSDRRIERDRKAQQPAFASLSWRRFAVEDAATAGGEIDAAIHARIAGDVIEPAELMQVVVDAYNLLELEEQERRWPPASNALIAEVRAFLTEMRSDPAGIVSDNARSMLANIAHHRP